VIYFFNMSHSENPRFTIEDVQKSLQKRDDTLPDEIKEQYPVLTYEEIREQYPDSWLAFQFVRAGAGGGFSRGSKGRVYGSSNYLEDVKEIVNDITAAYPQIGGILRTAYSEPSVPRIIRRPNSEL
jgi:hypothetical protein